VISRREGTMKYRVVLFLGLLLVPRWVLALDPGTKIRDGFVDIDILYQAVPAVLDYNGDGNKDLLIGEHITAATDYGKVRVYLNTNTDDNPLFSGWSYAQYTTVGGSYDIYLEGYS
jgi:hypothetical protein